MPPTVDRIVTDIPISGSSAKATEVYNGRIPSNWNQEFTEICSEMTKEEQVQIEVSLKEVKKDFQKWREATSMSPSGRHLGHYKVLMVPDGQDKEKCIRGFRQNNSISHGCNKNNNNERDIIKKMAKDNKHDT